MVIAIRIHCSFMRKKKQPIELKKKSVIVLTRRSSNENSGWFPLSCVEPLFHTEVKRNRRKATLFFNVGNDQSCVIYHNRRKK